MFTPDSPLIGLYWCIIALLLIGQSLLLAVTRHVPTQRLLANGVGVRLSLINLLMAAWVLFWALRMFLISEIILLVVFAVVLSISATLRAYRPDKATFLDHLFIYAPVTMINVILFSVDIWQNGLLALGWFKYVGSHGDKVHHPRFDSREVGWAAFGVVLGTSIVNGMITFAFADFVWAFASVYVAVALALVEHGKPPQVFITLILGAVLVVVSLLASWGWIMIKKDQQRRGEIRLEEDEEEDSDRPLAGAPAV